MATVHLYQIDENLNCYKISDVKIRGGSLYQKYIESKKYIFYCGDVLEMYCFAVDLKGICYKNKDIAVGSPKYPITSENEVDGIGAIINHPGIPTDDAKYKATVTKFNTPESRTDIAKDEAIATLVVSVISRYIPSNSKYLAMSDVHGNVAAFMIGYLFRDRVEVINIGDCVNKKANYYGKYNYDKLHDGPKWNYGYFSDLESCYISSIISQSNIINIHGNHDFNIDYPSLLLIVEPKYQLWFSHGIINPAYYDALEEVTDGNKHFFYIKKDSELYKKLPLQDHYAKRYDAEDEVFDVTPSLRMDLTTKFYIASFAKTGRKVSQVAVSDVQSAMEKLVKDRCSYYNPIFTFGHDFRYEILGYEIQKHNMVPILGTFGKYDDISYRSSGSFGSRIFGVDGVQDIRGGSSGGNLMIMILLFVIIICVIGIVNSKFLAAQNESIPKRRMGWL